MPLAVTITKKQEGVYLVSPVGSFDSYTYTDFDDKVEPILVSPIKVVVLDMSGVTYISSRGLTSIFKTKKIVEENGGSFIMAGLQPQVKEVFEIIKVLPTMKVFASVEELDAYLAKIQKGEIEKSR